jgi:3-methyladenine DNA glycosylase AlkD
MREEIAAILDQLEESLVQHAQPEQASGMKAYMKQKFDYIGIQKPLRAQISKPFLKQLNDLKADPAEILRFCWAKHEREWQYIGMDYALKAKKLWKADWLTTMEYCITHKSWWDTVDALAVHGVGGWLQDRSELRVLTVERWRHSEALWLERTAILFQLMYKKETDAALLADLCLQFAHSKEFFIQKAMGWALRQYARTNCIWVRDFVATHPLPKLTQREALKHQKT